MQELPSQVGGLCFGVFALLLVIVGGALISALISSGILRRTGRETPTSHTLSVVIVVAAIAAIVLGWMLGTCLSRLHCPVVLIYALQLLTFMLGTPLVTALILGNRDELGDGVTILIVLVPCAVVFAFPMYLALLTPLLSHSRSIERPSIEDQLRATVDQLRAESAAEESEPEASEQSDTELSDEPPETVEPDQQSSLEEREVESKSEDDGLRFAELIEQKLLTSSPEEVAGLLQQNKELGVKFVQHRADLAAEFFRDHPELAVETFQKNPKLAAEFFHGNPEVAAELFQDHPDLAHHFSEEQEEAAAEAEGKMTEEETQDKPEDEEETVAETTQEPTYRTWQDETGDFSVEAAFGGFAMGTVILHKKDGSKLKVPMERLSEEDQEWIRGRAKRR